MRLLASTLRGMPLGTLLGGLGLALAALPASAHDPAEHYQMAQASPDAQMAPPGPAPTITPATPEEPAQPGKAQERMPGRPDAHLYIGWPNNGEVVGTRFKVWFGLRNFGVAPAGVRKENTGHHHLLVDTDIPPLDEPIPNDKNHVHFGKGQTETYLELPPGRHTLQLLLADHDHVPHNPPIVSKKITITVVPQRTSVPNVASR
ncbi:DUF4399 domain-containing protein [Azospirillum sp.]|uniref:DUF4399 domain-containing protein n=1 Tax=Azospirillum sp. TaxID=34012 RepID=UPI002D358166|nr:DUF4399 domain-containing protein [Azospirillum sp.]HYD66057.1 DUF4399 domain-containing protein [Azospirillum sp.]